MVLTENSGLVKIWCQRVRDGKATLDDVPKLYNLKEVVTAIIEAENVEKGEA